MDDIKIENKHVSHPIEKIFYLQRDTKSVLNYNLLSKKLSKVRVDIEKNFPANY